MIKMSLTRGIAARATAATALTVEITLPAAAEEPASAAAVRSQRTYASWAAGSVYALEAASSSGQVDSTADDDALVTTAELLTPAVLMLPVPLIAASSHQPRTSASCSAIGGTPRQELLPRRKVSDEGKTERGADNEATAPGS